MFVRYGQHLRARFHCNRDHKGGVAGGRVASALLLQAQLRAIAAGRDQPGRERALRLALDPHLVRSVQRLGAHPATDLHRAADLLRASLVSGRLCSLFVVVSLSEGWRASAYNMYTMSR